MSISNFNDLKIRVFPNPTNNNLTVSGNLKKASKIILRDNIGRIVSVTEINPNNYTHKINIKGLSKGIYFLSIDNNNTIKKIVKQ